MGRRKLARTPRSGVLRQSAIDASQAEDPDSMYAGSISRPLPVADCGAGSHQPFSWRNYFAHSIEGGCFVGGVAFLGVETVLPTMTHALGGPPWLVAMMPVLLMAGFVTPALFTAHIFERRARMLPFLRISGIFQRLPFLIGGLVLFFFAESHPRLTLAVVASVPLLSGISGGMGASAWMELTSRILPPRRRASALAVRMVVAGLIGVTAGWAVEHILARYPGAPGYALLHFCTFACLVVSYGVFLLQREEPDHNRARQPGRSLWQNLQSLPGLMREYPDLRRYVCLVPCAMGIWVTVPFLAVHARIVLERPEAFVGRLVMAQMIGGMSGVALGGWIGDRCGGRQLLRLALAAYVALFAAVCFIDSAGGFMLLFGCWGAAFNAHQVGGFTLAMEVAPVRRRPTALAMLATVNAPSLLLMSTLGGQIQQWLPGSDPQMAMPVTITITLVLVAQVLLWRIRDPRSAAAQRAQGIDQAAGGQAGALGS